MSDSHAYLVFHDYDRQLTFRWDGESSDIEVHSGGLADHTVETISLQGAPVDTNLIGWIRWFESICASHIRMQEASEESP